MKCIETVYETSPYCILHIKFPDVKTDFQYYYKIKRDKKAKVQEKMEMENGDFNFERAILPEIDLSHYKKLGKSLRFTDAIIKR